MVRQRNVKKSSHNVATIRFDDFKTQNEIKTIDSTGFLEYYGIFY